MNYFTLQKNTNLDNFLRENPLLTSHIGKTYNDILGKIKYPDSRKYKDETTTQFNETFFKNADGNINNLNNFTFYAFQKINFDIISNINDILTLHHEYIKYNEDIILIFKGGNIISYYINKILNIINNDKFESFIKDDMKMGGISDTDFTIYILNESQQKYNLIYKYVSDLLYGSLVEIRDNFEVLLINGIDNNKNNIFNLYNIKQLENETIENITNLNIFKLFDENFSNNKNILEIDNEIQFELEKLVFDDVLEPYKLFNSCQEVFKKIRVILITNHIILSNIIVNNIRFSVYKDIYTSARYIKILTSIKYIIGKYIGYFKNLNSLSKLFPGLTDFILFYRHIELIITIQREISNISLNNILYELNNFYSKDNINDFLNSICTKFNEDEYRKNKFYKYTPGKIKYTSVYQMRYNINDKNIQIPNIGRINKNNKNNNNTSINYKIFDNLDNRTDVNNNINTKPPTTYLKRESDFISKNIPKIRYSTCTSNNNQKYFHYISVNSTINSIIENSHLIQFDLYRIKLNVCLSHIIEVDNNRKSSKILNIPSEFIDVSIPKFNDMCLSKFRKNIYHNNKNFNDFFSYLSINNKKNIMIYNLSSIIEDLSIVLFKQNTPIPWIDTKYNKRINRMVLLSCILFIKNSIINNKYNELKVYLLEFNKLIKNICINLYSYYNRREDFKNIKQITKIIDNNETNIRTIKDCIDLFIMNNSDKILFNESVINNFKENDKYFSIDYNKLNTILNINNTFDFNLIFSSSFNDFLNFSFRNIIYDIVDSNSLYILIDYIMYKYNFVFDTEEDKHKYIHTTFRIENYKCIKYFSDIFEKIIMYMLFNNDVTLQSILNKDYSQIPISNIIHGGHVIINNRKSSIKMIKEMYLKKMNNKTKELINKYNIKDMYSKNLEINQKLNQKLNIKILKDSIQFQDVLIKDLNIKLNFKKNNISELYSNASYNEPELYSGASYDEPEYTDISSKNKVNKSINEINGLDPYILMYINELTSKEINYLINQNNLKKKYKLGKYANKI